MAKEISLGDHVIGPGHPVFIVAEIGINHNGDVKLARKLIDVAAVAGCSAIKFQKRTSELCVPQAERDKIRETPWGPITYLDYRKRIEFGEAEYREINAYCRERGIIWFASPWDVESVDFLEMFSPPCHKVASACLTDDSLLNRLAETGRLVIISTGMSSMEEIHHAVSLLDMKRLIVTHSTSSYPCLPEELNLNMIATLRDAFDCPVGYSGHEIGLQTTYAAVALGACLVERHITLDRNMWGSDQSASVESTGVSRMVRDIWVIETAMGDGVKQIYETELPVRNRLRRVK
jgi:N-acetylneuraminate synthase